LPNDTGDENVNVIVVFEGTFCAPVAGVEAVSDSSLRAEDLALCDRELGEPLPALDRSDDRE
jgi:hypothetical protein